MVSIPFKREGIYKGSHKEWCACGWSGFNSLQTGRHIQRQETDLLFTPSRCLSFNSLQTGRHIQSKPPAVEWPLTEDLFQFPSNGKAYTKCYHCHRHKNTVRKSFNSLQTGRHIQSWARRSKRKLNQVSIPFKREGIYKEGMTLGAGSALAFRFNSLQTGRHIQSWICWWYLWWDECFNSLQTGRHIQSQYPVEWNQTIHVSIPFKREGIYKGSGCLKRFQQSVLSLFQFPSNGKAYPKTISVRPTYRTKWVSIPFKREGIYKEVLNMNEKVRNRCFNSLQTGRHIQRTIYREWQRKK